MENEQEDIFCGKRLFVQAIRIYVFIKTLWGQYLLNRNKDPFIKSLDTQPKTGVGIRLEYNPNHNTKFSIDAGFRENSFDSSKLNYSVEGKAAIKF